LEWSSLWERLQGDHRENIKLGFVEFDVEELVLRVGVEGGSLVSGELVQCDFSGDFYANYLFIVNSLLQGFFDLSCEASLTGDPELEGLHGPSRCWMELLLDYS
jgi:hypothetical protein